MDPNLEIINALIKNWDKVEKISSEVWKKVKLLFDKGNKSLGFIKRKSIFLNYLEISQKSFIERYSKYIVPAEYRGYLLESIVISKLYKKGKLKDADKKRSELNKVNKNAGRIYNLYNTGILNILFEKIDDLIKEGKNEEEIRGIVSKELDDLINDKSIIYANFFHNEEDLYEKVKTQLINNRYCLIYGSGDNVKKIKYLFDKILDDSDLDNFEIKHNKKKIGGVQHFNLFIVEKIILQEKDD